MINRKINRKAVFSIGEVVKHKIHSFRGVIFDVDPTFDNTDELLNSIPEDYIPKKDKPFYHLLAEAPSQPSYVAYVSQKNLLPDNLYVELSLLLGGYFNPSSF